MMVYANREEKDNKSVLLDSNLKSWMMRLREGKGMQASHLITEGKIIFEDIEGDAPFILLSKFSFHKK